MKGKLFICALMLSAPDIQASKSAHTPKDVSEFKDRKKLCEHFAGEEPYDKARAAEIYTKMTELRCGDLDKDIQKLKKKYGEHSKHLKGLIEENPQ